MVPKKYLILLLVLLSGLFGKAQTTYNPHAAFAPLDLYPPANRVRAANGAPGPDYWQNRADYQVDAKLDTASKKISGTVVITYTNNSPDGLSDLWLQLVQNIDRTDSRAARIQHPMPDESRDANRGFHIHHVQRLDKGKTRDLPYIVDGTRMQIRLPQPLKGEGTAITLRIAYDYILQPSGGGGRSGYMDSRNGRIFEVSYWYPRMCVYDDLHGWNTLPFLGLGEFYLDYGDIDYSITLPAGLLVAGTGVLDNPEAVLTPLEIDRLAQARQSDQTVLIRKVAEGSEPATKSATNGWLTWHFHMDHTRDVAWTASEAFVWDAARINLPEGKTALAMSLYPEESMGDSAYGRGTEYLKASVELFSNKWYPYPYRVALNIGGPVGGMEFPGMAMDWWGSRNKSLFALISHEIGHSWYSMIVGSNERRHAWMDEGFNTFVDLLAQAEFNKGEYAPKRDGEYAPGGGNPAEEIVPFITNAHIAPIVMPADAIKSRYIHPLAYFKTAFGLVLLRNVILGPDRFDHAFQAYTKDWAYKHPAPADFFREIENKAGADLDWFWRGWFLNNWQLDQAVAGVQYVKNDPAQGAVIRVANLKKMPMPLMVRITQENGTQQNLQLPVAVWQTDTVATFKVNTTHRLAKVELDPQKQLPDVNRTNNVWTQ